MDITIRELYTNEEYLEIIELQKIIWRLHNYNDCIPNHIYMAVMEIGGLVLGAYINKRMVGFLMVLVGHGLTGLWTKTVFHHYLFILPILILNIVLGHLFYKRIPKDKFNTLIHFLLLAVGLLLLVNTILVMTSPETIS